MFILYLKFILVIYFYIMKRSLFLLGFILSFSFCLNSQKTFAKENLRQDFINNKSIIYTLNIRNFNAVDNNHDGIIQKEQGDIPGSFLNAKEKLSALKQDGITTIYVLPITPVGKLKALGTAGSLYAMDEFDKINPQLKDINSNLTLEQEAQEFVDRAHSLGLNVILDLPSCGSYDLSLRKPDWYILNDKNEALIPADWTDVRLFKVYNKDKTLNKTTLDNFKSFVDMAQNLGFDGIRADVAGIKPKAFWSEIINHARTKNKNFLFIAEASPSWNNPAPNGVSDYSSIQDLLDSGFDGYYGSWSDFKNIKTKKEFDKKINENLKILAKNKDKAIMAGFATHDQQAPILRGKNYWRMILWLNSTLKVNSYYLDGFSYGDDFIYDYEGKKNNTSLTDDDTYFVHSGLFDIFNLSAPIRVKHPELKKEYLKAIGFKKNHNALINNGTYKNLKTNNDNVFAYSITHNNQKILAVGSLDEENMQEIKMKNDSMKKDYLLTILNAKQKPIITKKEIKFNLEPLEMQVYFIQTPQVKENKK